jgi:hypothetical protein
MFKIASTPKELQRKLLEFQSMKIEDLAESPESFAPFVIDVYDLPDNEKQANETLLRDTGNLVKAIEAYFKSLFVTYSTEIANRLEITHDEANKFQYIIDCAIRFREIIENQDFTKDILSFKTLVGSKKKVRQLKTLEDLERERAAQEAAQKPQEPLDPYEIPGPDEGPSRRKRTERVRKELPELKPIEEAPEDYDPSDLISQLLDSAGVSFDQYAKIQEDNPLPSLKEEEHTEQIYKIPYGYNIKMVLNEKIPTFERLLKQEMENRLVEVYQPLFDFNKLISDVKAWDDTDIYEKRKIINNLYNIMIIQAPRFIKDYKDRSRESHVFVKLFGSMTKLGLAQEIFSCIASLKNDVNLLNQDPKVRGKKERSLSRSAAELAGFDRRSERNRIQVGTNFLWVAFIHNRALNIIKTGVPEDKAEEMAKLDWEIIYEFANSNPVPNQEALTPEEIKNTRLFFLNKARQFMEDNEDCTTDEIKAFYVAELQTKMEAQKLSKDIHANEERDTEALEIYFGIVEGVASGRKHDPGLFQELSDEKKQGQEDILDMTFSDIPELNKPAYQEKINALRSCVFKFTNLINNQDINEEMETINEEDLDDDPFKGLSFSYLENQLEKIESPDVLTTEQISLFMNEAFDKMKEIALEMFSEARRLYEKIELIQEDLLKVVSGSEEEKEKVQEFFDGIRAGWHYILYVCNKFQISRTSAGGSQATKEHEIGELLEGRKEVYTDPLTGAVESGDRTPEEEKTDQQTEEEKARSSTEQSRKQYEKEMYLRRLLQYQLNPKLSDRRKASQQRYWKRQKLKGPEGEETPTMKKKKLRSKKRYNEDPYRKDVEIRAHNLVLSQARDWTKTRRRVGKKFLDITIKGLLEDFIKRAQMIVHYAVHSAQPKKVEQIKELYKGNLPEGQIDSFALTGAKRETKKKLDAVALSTANKLRKKISQIQSSSDFEIKERLPYFVALVENVSSAFTTLEKDMTPQQWADKIISEAETEPEYQKLFPKKASKNRFQKFAEMFLFSGRGTSPLSMLLTREEVISNK